MPRLSWKIKIALILSGLTVVLTLLHISLFNDPRTLFFYLVLDVVFVPVQVLLVSIVIEQLLSERETQSKRRKLNMVIGSFMGELGTRLLVNINRLRVDPSGKGTRSGKLDFQQGQVVIQAYLAGNVQ